MDKKKAQSIYLPWDFQKSQTTIKKISQDFIKNISKNNKGKPKTITKSIKIKLFKIIISDS